jgi:uncharacterized damage-inducible protein DinB
MLNWVEHTYSFNRWANERILGTAGKLSTEQYFTRCDASFGTIHGILVHILNVQELWLTRWQGQSPTGLPDAALLPGLAEVRAKWDEVEAHTRDFIAGLQPADLAQDVIYTNFRGEKHGYKLWELMQHQANHATQHRSEAAFVMTQWGVSSGPMDMTIYMDEQKSHLIQG